MNNKIVLHLNASQLINYQNYFQHMQITEELMLAKLDFSIMVRS